MEARAAKGRSDLSWRLWALLPIVLLALAVGAFVAEGSSIVDLIGQNPPQPDEFDVRRVEFEPGEIRVRVTNPQTDDLTIASVTVDDAIVPFEVDGDTTLGRLRSSTVVIPFEWVEDDPITVGITSSTGIETIEEIPAAVETPGLDGSSILGYAIIGFLVGVLPVGLGLLWLPSLRRARQEWLTAFMALTAGLLSFLGVEALFEAFALQAAVPGAFGGPGLVLLGVALSYLTMTFLSARFSASGGGGVVERCGARAARRDRDRRPQPRRGARDRHVVRLRPAHARLVPDRRLHGSQHHRGTRDRGAGGRRGRGAALDAARAAGPRRRRACDPRRLDRRLRRERRPGGALLRRRRRRGVRGRRRGRPLRACGAIRPASAPAGRSAASSPGSRSCTRRA